MPPDLYNYIYHATFTVKRIELSLMWTLLIVTTLVALALIKYIRCLFGDSKNSKEKDCDKSQVIKMLPKTSEVQVCAVPIPAIVAIVEKH